MSFWDPIPNLLSKILLYAQFLPIRLKVGQIITHYFFVKYILFAGQIFIYMHNISVIWHNLRHYLLYMLISYFVHYEYFSYLVRTFTGHLTVWQNQKASLNDNQNFRVNS